ncbi:glycosyltransferase family 39 protein [Dyella caseinilytica]|uniref:Glycosyltransferase family 39 protein n=2 Tax=Dyella caseinilytica TaxID=1849581 RepID=A0ABX7GZB6_9GAMM|nr:glycosyltransferase family 39 protein [Dyella caseinilytica]QRN55819.1 glycosyltransferase family 39 protein [Dyella caseinilytica]
MGLWKARIDSESDASVVAGLARWRAAFVTAFVCLLVVKLILAATLQPFGDEAFYWQESRHPAWGYSDLPPLTAWLIRVGEAIAGHGVLGMRWPFLLMGSALPWLLVVFGRRVFGARAGWQAGLLCLCLPLAGSLGVMAMPDVPLTVAGTVAMLALLRVMDESRWRDWLLLGVALAVCWMSHYRAAMFMLAGLLLCLLTPRGRQQWTRGGFWLAMGVAAIGLLPLLISNWQQHGAGLAFQLVERNPWRFHADALVQPLEQAVTCTPLLYICLLWAAWHAWKRRAAGPWDVIALLSLTFIVVYFVAGLFADDQRFRVHWPLPGYLPLLAALPVLLHEAHVSLTWRRFALAGATLAFMAQLAGLLYLGLAAYPDTARWLGAARAFPTAFIGWQESADIAREQFAVRPAVLVADNFMMAAELDFQFDGQRPVYTLDSPLNVKYGRAPQVALWGWNEIALRQQHAGESVLLVVDEHALRERERGPWLGSLCARIDNLQPLQRLSLFDGRKSVAFYRGQVAAAPFTAVASPGDCIAWRRAAAGEE